MPRQARIDGAGTLHHIICDGWSIDVLLRELMTRYQSDATAPQLQHEPPRSVFVSRSVRMI